MNKLPWTIDMCRDEGALEALVKLLEGAEDATVAKHALTAISSLVKNNLENKSVVREANGVQVSSLFSFLKTLLQ